MAYVFKLFRQDGVDDVRNQNSSDNSSIIGPVFEFIFEVLPSVIAEIFKALLHH
jgi:hypothetical protein